MSEAFNPVTSRPATLWNILFGTVLTLLALATACLFIASIVLFFTEPDEPMGLKLGLLGISACMVGVWVWIIARATPYTQIQVTPEGLRYYHHYKKKEVRFIPWKAFTRNSHQPQNRFEPVYDINKKTTSGMVNGARITADQFQWWYMKDKEPVYHLEQFRAAHPFYCFFANRGELMAAFLQGVKRYRPDIRVDPALYTQFFIHPDTLLYEREKEIKIEWLAWIFVLLIGALIWYFTS